METYKNFDNRHIPYCVSFSFNKSIHSFYYEEEIDIVAKSIEAIFQFSFKKVYYYIHNLNYDGILILNSLSKQNKLEYSFYMRDKDLYEIKISFHNKIIFFKCSFKLIPASLKKITETFNIKKKMPFPYAFVNKNNLFYIGNVPEVKYFETKDDWESLKVYSSVFDLKKYTISYCENDVIITKSFVIIFSNLISNFNVTLRNVLSTPALVKKIFIKNFNNNKINYSSNIFLDTFLRPGYFGGNCQVYGNLMSDEKVFHFDFSGMYAQCMREKFPFGKHKIIENNFNLQKQGFYWIEFESNNEYPVLPHHSSNKKLMFTNGKIRGCYWFEEIQLFLNNGGKINKLLSGIEYENFDYVFNDYVNYFTKIREKGGEYKTFGKLAINSLYGSFGINFDNTHTFFIKKDEEIFLKKLNVIWKIYLNDIIIISVVIDNNLKKIIKVKSSSPETNIAVAASITSKARIKLYKAQQEVIKNDGRILYSDTDSVFAAYKRNVSGETHGEIIWTEGEKKIKDAVFMLPKAYALLYEDDSELVKIKGFNQQISFSEVKKKFFENDKIYIENYSTLEKSNFILKEQIYKKNIPLSFYSKRRFTDDKKKTIPFTKVENNYI